MKEMTTEMIENIKKDQEIMNYIAAGSKTMAVKAYKDLTGADLKTAYDYVNTVAAAMEADSLEIIL